MTTFTAGINKLRSIIMQVSKARLGETSKDIVSIFKEIIEDGKEYIKELTKICEREYSSFEYDILPEENLSLLNYSDSAFSMDTYN